MFMNNNFLAGQEWPSLVSYRSLINSVRTVLINSVRTVRLIILIFRLGLDILSFVLELSVQKMLGLDGPSLCTPYSFQCTGVKFHDIKS